MELVTPELNLPTYQVLNIFGKFEAFGKVILGLNLREAEQVDQLLGFEPV